jgi:hypothetical protein
MDGKGKGTLKMRRITLDLTTINIERHRSGKMALTPRRAERLAREHLLIAAMPPPDKSELDAAWATVAAPLPVPRPGLWRRFIEMAFGF